MLSLTFAVLLSVANMLYAASIYLSLQGWLVPHEPSGMQLLMHWVITAPVTLITTLWLWYLNHTKKVTARFWQCNLVGLAIPVLSVQTGVTYFHYDHIGLVLTVLVAIGLLYWLLAAWRHARRGSQELFN